MKRKLISLLLAAVLCLGLALPVRAAEALTPETQEEILLEVSDFIRENCLTSSLEDDPLGRVFPSRQKEGALLQALQKDAGLYERLMRKMLSAERVFSMTAAVQLQSRMRASRRAGSASRMRHSV